MNVLKNAWELNDIQRIVLNRLYFTEMKGGENLNISLPSYHVFFVECLPISPSRFRLTNSFGDMVGDHPQTQFYKELIEASNNLKLKRAGKDIYPESKFLRRCPLTNG